MDSSSDESFAWTDTSSDKFESKNMVNEQESDFDKSFKRKLQKELFQNGEHSEPEADEPRVKKKKKIKREPNSPSPVKREANGHDHDAAAERWLRLKVKQEQAASPARPASPPAPPTRSPDRDPPRKKKRKRDRVEPEPAEDSVDAEPPRKKKKKRKKETSDIEDAVVDKFEAEETVVEEAPPRAPPSAARAPAPAPRYTSQEFIEDDPSSGDERPAPASPASPAPPAPKALKIRERITFEEEPDERAESETEAPTAPRGRRLARYLRSRAGLRAAGGALAGACAVRGGEDAWLVLAPRGLAAAELAGAALAPGARCKLTAGGRHYEALPEPAARAALLAGGGGGGGWRLRGLALRGALRLRERVPRQRAPAAAPPEPPRAVPLPATRLRHPLLGAHYDQALQPAPAARGPAPDPDTLPEEPPPPRKKKKKRDRSRRSPPPPPPAAPWDSERAIEASLFGC